jgi:hypothetical protein
MHSWEIRERAYNEPNNEHQRAYNERIYNEPNNEHQRAYNERIYNEPNNEHQRTYNERIYNEPNNEHQRTYNERIYNEPNNEHQRTPQRIPPARHAFGMFGRFEHTTRRHLRRCDVWWWRTQPCDFGAAWRKRTAFCF